MEFHMIPPEMWVFLGVAVTAVGALAGVIVNAVLDRGKARVDASSQLVDDLLAEVTELRGEVRHLRAETSTAHKEMVEARTEAFAIKDTARLHLSMTATYIYQLRAHINTEQPPPAPPVPPELVPLLPDFMKPPTNQ